MFNLIKHGYVLDDERKVWNRSGYSGINYSDGEKVEQTIGEIIDRASDITVLSVELKRHCVDWPTLYHLSGSRANLLRPFESALSSDILEIGAGCGAITRYLGECGGNVLALEGSPRRAAIARARTRELENVTVVAEKFDAFECDHKFDVITLIGVFEYANLFTDAANPQQAMLAKARSLLKPSGKLIIAIENQLGLKYFAGYQEDHLGQPMYGIEGRYRNDQPQTFGRQTLTAILTQSGFFSSEFLLPFPDYKLPVSILTERGLKTKGFDAAALAWQSARRDPQRPPYCNFSMELAWPEIFKNGLALELSNSFLIVASQQSDAHIDQEALAFHYSTDRVSQYCKETKFVRIADEDIVVHYRSLDYTGRSDLENERGIINCTYPASTTYSHGQPLSSEFMKVVTRDGWTIAEVGDFLKRYIAILVDITKNSALSLANIEPNTPLPGNCFDLSPQNIIVAADGRAEPIDTEWTLHRSIDAGYLLFRSLILMMGPITRFGVSASNPDFTRTGFIEEALLEIGFELNEQHFSEYISLESKAQEAVTGLPATHFIDWQPMSLLPTMHTFQVLTRREAEIAQRDIEINRLNVVIQEVSDWVKENQFDVLHKQLAEKQAELMRMSDWADGMRKQLERRNPLLRKASNTVDKLKKLGRQHLAQTFVGDLVRYIRDRRNYHEKKVTFDAVRESIEENNGRLIITFPIITWDFRWQRPQHIVTRMRNHGYSILYIAMSVAALGRKIRNRHDARSLLGSNSLEQHIQQIWLHSSADMNIYTHQIEGDDLHNLFGGLDAAIAELKPRSVYYLLQFPGWWPVAKMLRESYGGKVIFDCMDDHAGFSTNTPLALQTERELIQDADLVIASSGVLEQKIRPLNTNTIQVKNGTEFEHFNDAKPNGLLDHLADRPIIGYYGAISDWFDMDIVSHCATQHPEWNFVLIGSTFGADLTSINKLDNVHLLGEKKYSDLPGYLAYFDVCTIPFKIIPLTLATNPVKFYEYLSSGKPVVSVALLELLPYSEACYLANNAEEFETLLKLALSEKDDVQKISRRLEIAKENSWDSRAISIINAMESC